MSKIIFEHTFIENKELPGRWQTEASLKALEQFLQSNWEQRSALYSDSDNSKIQQFIEFDHRNGIKTKNYIGSIVFDTERIDIFPKVYCTDGPEPTMADLIRDLTIWLHYCDSANYPFISMPSSFDNTKDTFEVFASVYLQYVESALKRQAYMTHEDITETGSAVKGKIDFIDYATNKYASGQKHRMNYTYSGFVFDNKVNRIIKATCLMINRITKNPKSKGMIRTILGQLDDVSDIACSPSDCEKVSITGIQSNYRVIMQLSKMFLMNKTASGIQGKLDAFCFLFPAELLFEGFVGGFLKEAYKEKADVRLQSRSHYLAEAFLNDESCGKVFQLREDIIIDADEYSMVLDTKYKTIKPLSELKSYKKLGIEDADIKQMVVYAIENDAIELCQN